MKNKRVTKVIQYLLVALLVVLSCPVSETQAATKSQTQTATLRIVSTTDLHGQVSTMHYDTGSEKSGSLAQVYTLIKKARKEVGGTGNTLTVDIGDSVYGYAADYILANSGEDAVQPIYQAMATVGYDALTLGNHDFDYGYEYIDKQLTLSGLKSKCVLSNVILTDTGTTPWNETMVVTKKVKTNKNKTVKVKIGIIGVTLPTMSTYSDCKENLASLPIVSTVKTEAAALKQQGVNLVVVLAHTSFGTQNPDEDADNALYAITKLADVDAVAAGHGHKNYPSSDENVQNYYNYANVDKKTGLMNGKPVTMIKDHGAGIGVIDFKLKIDASGSITLSKAAEELRMVDNSVSASKAILATQEAQIEAVDQSLETVVASLDSDQPINSYFALLEDNYAIQLANESKLQYALSYTGGAGKSAYGDYPVVAVTKYNLYNSSSPDDQIRLDGTITMKDILNMQQDNHNNNILYWATGAQIKEWLEWSASIYATSAASISSDAVLESLLQQYGASSIVDGDWLEDWNAFCVFDGIEYTIDATQPARYTKAGNLKNEAAHRIVSLTCNGQPVADDQKFILVSNSISSGIEANGSISSQKVLGKTDLAYQHLAQYIREQAECGSLAESADNNWDVCFDSSPYIVRSSVLSQQDAAVKSWFRQFVNSDETFAYYLADFTAELEDADTDSPLLVVASSQTEQTDGPIELKVQATDRSGIASLAWMPGKVEKEDAAWKSAQAVSGGSFTVSENGFYSVYAADLSGNCTVRYIQVSNLDESVLPAPTINKVTNRTSILSGTARAGLTVCINANGNLYTEKALEDGTYSCTVERMPAGAQVSVYCIDELVRTSKTVTTTVIKNGPNVPQIDEVSNKSLCVTGSYSDNTTTIVAIVGTTVYCPGEQGAEDYRKSDAYKSKRTVELVDYAQSGKDFVFSVPTQDAGTTVKFVAIDKAGRTSSTLSVETTEQGPDMPKVFTVTDAENYLYGNVTSVGEQASVTVTCGSGQFTGSVAQDGTFAVQTDGLAAGSQFTVVVNDRKDGIMRSSLPVSAEAESYLDYLDTNAVTVSDIYDSDTVISGEALDGGCSLYMALNGTITEIPVAEDGSFSYAAAGAVPAGSEIFFFVQSEGELIGVAQKSVQQRTVLSPQAPVVLTNPVTSQTEQMQVLTMEQGILAVKIDGVIYSYTDCVYSAEYGGYIYTVPLPQTELQQILTIYLINSQGLMSDTCTVVRT